jgi:hypothetical protein
MLTAQGQPITATSIISVSMPTPNLVPPPPPQGAVVQSYDFGPAGATFVPPLKMTLKYDPATLQPGVSPDTLYIAYWDGSQWQKLVSTIDTVNDTVTALVPHFTDFAVLAQATMTTTTMPTTTSTTPHNRWWQIAVIVVMIVIVIALIVCLLFARRKKKN